MVCPSCGGRVWASARFCGECGIALNPAASPPVSERRQVTAMFCDIVNSTAMGEQMDAEDLHEILLDYQETCRAIIEPAHGQILQFLGDGILAVFGVPAAREDDARRAVNAALKICRRMPGLSREVERRHGLTLAVRIGVHTGLIVVDETVAGPVAQQSRPIGNAFNIGARLQELAPPNGVIISGDTHDLVQGHFIVEPLEPRSLKGISQVTKLYHVIGPSLVRNVFEARLARGLSPLVGREAELAACEAEWARAAAGAVRSVLLTGDPGIGKSRLLYEFQRRRKGDRCVQIVCHCAAQYQNTAFHPIATELARVFRIAPQHDRPTRLRRISAELRHVGITAATAAADIDLVFADAGADAGTGAGAPTESATAIQQRVIQTLLTYVVASARRHPLLLVFEDMHWADPSTAEFLRHLSAEPASAPILVVASVRSSALVDTAAHRTVAVERIEASACESLIDAIAGARRLPRAVVAELVGRSDGVPLFLEELTKSAAEALVATSGPARGQSIVPASLQDSIMARLDRLGSAKQVAQVGALIGRSFPVNLLSAIWNDARTALQTEIGLLVDAEILFEHEEGARAQPGGRLEFKHELVRDVASQSMLRLQRRDIHARIADTLARDFTEECGRHPELLAYHYTQGGEPARALPLWERAGHRAVRRSASQEAVNHFTRALRLLDAIGGAEARRAKELDLHISLAAPLMAAKGYGAPELDHSIARAMALSAETGDSSRVFPLMYGRWSFDQVTGNLRRARDLALQYLELAELSSDVEPRMIACRLVGTSLLMTGRPSQAATLLSRAIAMFDEAEHTRLAYVYGADIKVMSQCSLALAQWVLGETRSADANVEAACERATVLGHANTLFYASSHRLILHVVSERIEGFGPIEAEYRWLLAQHDLPLWLSSSKSFTAWACLRHGDLAQAERLYRESLAAMEAVNLVFWSPLTWMYLGETLGALERFDEADAAFACAQEVIERTGESFIEAEMFRLWASMRRQGGMPGASELFDKGVAIAQKQGAVALLKRLAADKATQF